MKPNLYVLMVSVACAALAPAVEDVLVVEQGPEAAQG